MTHIELASLADDSSLDERHHEVTDWRCDPPVLHGPRVVLREVEVSDAKALRGVLGSAEVSRFISAPPSTSDGVAQFITWARRQRAAGRYIAFAVVPRGADSPVGIFHVRALETGFRAADWGFALTSELWGTGIFREAAELVLDFVFDVVGTDRVEGRVAR